ncbi:MAG: nucleotidyltransferase family protein [Bacteroidetes bacterium]|nr:nucleotidyltransferase family protein [Bacteroidota bacterium]
MSKADIINTIVNYLKQYKVKEIGIFGSFVRDEMTDKSDIDVLVEYSRGTTLFDIAGMQIELTEKLGRKVDLVDKEAVYPPIMKYILRDLKTVYHA